jgi:hypothetical protein
MKTKKWAIIFLLFASIILFAAQSALGGCEVAALDALIETGGNAPGTKLSGPITVFYQCIEPDSNDCLDNRFLADMYFFLRLRKGAEFYSFAGKIEEVNFPDFESDVANIQAFFDDTVLPALYPGCDEAGNPACPDIVLKSYDMDVDWEAPPANVEPGLFFFIADIVVAIQD